jgi:hypothetical protein
VPVLVAVLGYVAVEKLGAAAALACKTTPVVPGPAKMDGTPVLLVTSKPLFAVAKAPITLAEEAKSNVLTAFVVGYVVVVLTMFVPFEIRSVPDAPAVRG